MHLSLLPDAYTIARLPPDAPIPVWAHAPFSFISRTPDELSIVSPTAAVPVPAPGPVQHGFRLLQVRGPLDFSLTGITASIAVPLAEAGISLIPIGTFDTDYFLIPEADLPAALDALAAAGHAVQP